MSSKNSPATSDKQLHWPYWAAAIFILVVGLGWMSESPGREELFGDTGKLWDQLKNNSGGWVPNYLLGHSSAIYDSTAIATFLSKAAHILFAWLIGAFAAQKLLILGFLPFAFWTMRLFLLRLRLNNAEASLGALLYLAMPSMLVAIGIYEHWTVGLCFVFTPLILRGILSVAENSSPREIVGLGLAASALALSYTKIAVTMSPILVLWTLEALRRNPANLRKALAGYACALGVAGLTAILILLPGSREFGFAAGFLFDPVDGWKHHYSFKTPLLWIDLWGSLTKGGDGNLTGDAAMFWIGLIPLTALSFALGLRSLAEWRASAVGRWFLILTASWLLGTWFSSGPDGILLGHINVLKTAQGLPDTSIPILWLSLIWLGWLVCRTASGLLAKSPVWIPGLLTAVVMVVPVFRIAEFFPLFGDIRAPESFWSVGGYCCLAGAVAISLSVLFTQEIGERSRAPLAVVVGILMLVEFYPVYSAFWTRGMGRELFTDYDQAAAFLKAAPIPGRVHPLSGRYFYLTLPEKSGRAVDTESLLRHFQLKWVRHLEIAGNASGEALQSYLNLAGVAYVLIDKEDPFSPKQMQDFFRSVYPVVFENRYFAVLANNNTLYPAFLAHDFVALPKEAYALAPAALQLLPKSLITVETDQPANGISGFAGQASGTNQIALLPQYQSQNGQPFVRVPLVGNRMDDYQRMTCQVPLNATGWLVVSEAWHPDWTVTIDGKPAKTNRTESALLGTYVPAGCREVQFQFRPPAWYCVSINLGIFFWLLSLASMLYLPSKWAPPKWRAWWVGMAG
jgi:hypothetical protein